MIAKRLAELLLMAPDATVFAYNGDTEQDEEVSCITVDGNEIKIYTDDIS